MAYLEPPFFVRAVFNPLAMRFGIGGTETLVVPRRRSGMEQRIPVVAVDAHGVTHVVSTRGESDWVKNLRASGACELRGRAGRRRFAAAEVPVEERAPILAAYRIRAGRTVDAYFEKLPDPADHPVFALTPAA